MKDELLEEKKEIEAKIKKAEEEIHFLKTMLYWEKKKLKLVSDQLEDVEDQKVKQHDNT